MNMPCHLIYCNLKWISIFISVESCATSAHRRLSWEKKEEFQLLKVRTKNKIFKSLHNVDVFSDIGLMFTQPFHVLVSGSSQVNIDMFILELSWGKTKERGIEANMFTLTSIINKYGNWIT